MNTLLPIVALAALFALAWMGARLAWIHSQTVLLAALLFVPDALTGEKFGLLVNWSRGLTWSNFVVPTLAVPLLLGAWWSGRRWWPERWPGLAIGMAALLLWSLLTLLPAAAGGSSVAFTRVQLLSVTAHACKLALFVLIGVALAGGGDAWRRRAGHLLLVGIGVNAGVGLAQAVGWMAPFSPLAGGAQPRATGLFYDANMYATCCAWALLWLLCQNPGPGRRRWCGGLLALAVAANLVAASSRAGYAACAAGALVLWCGGHRRAVARLSVLLVLAVLLFPARSWRRVQAALSTLDPAPQAQPLPASPVDVSTQDRLDAVRQAWRQIERHPLLGLGYGRALYLGVPAVGGGPVVPQAPFRGAQNMYLTVWAGTGVIGLALLLLAVLAPWRGWHGLRRWASAPVLAGFAGLLVACLTQETLWNARLLPLVILLTAGTGLGWSAAHAPVEPAIVLDR